MKKLPLLFTAALLLVTSAGCTQEQTSTNETSTESSIASTFPIDDTIDFDAMRKQGGIMLTISQQPGGDMTQEEFANNIVTYTIFCSGMITYSKADVVKELSESDYQAACTYAKKLCDGTLSEPVKDNSADMPSFGICAYNEESKEISLPLSSMESQAEFEALFPLIRAYFQ